MKAVKGYIDAVCAAGATDAQVKRVGSSTRYVFFESNTLKTLKSDTDTSLSVKAFAGNKAATASTKDEQAMPEIIAESLALANASKADEALCLPEPEPVEAIEGLYDENEPDLATCLAAAKELVDMARGYDPRVTIDSCIVQTKRTRYELANSRGIDVREDSTYSRCVLMGMAREGSQVSSFDHEMAMDVTWGRMHAEIESIAVRFAKGVVESLGARPAPKMTGHVLLSPDITGEILWTVSSLVNARSVQENASRFKGKIGRQVAAEIITIRDEPRVPGSFLSSAFDSEGVPTREMTIVEKGILQGYIYDAYTARKDGTRSTGHSSGGTGISLHAPVLAGTMPLAEMRTKMSSGVYVKRYSGDMNPLTGIFSGVVKGGRYIEKGEDVYSITDTMINTDLFDLYMNIEAVSNERELTGWGMQPYLLVNNVNIIGRS